MNKIAFIDLSTVAMGFGIFKKIIDGNYYKLINSGCLDLKVSKKVDSKTLRHADQKFEEFFKKYNPDFIIIEEPLYGKNQAGVVSIGMIRGVFIINALKHLSRFLNGLESIKDYNNTTWKKDFCQDGNASKDEIKELLTSIDYDFRPTTNKQDELDAVAMGIGWMYKNDFAFELMSQSDVLRAG